MAVYAAMQGAQFRTDGISAAQWAGTRGKAIMEALGRSVEPMPFLEDRIAVAMEIFHEAMKGQWTWSPTAASGAGGALLDGATLRGECAQLVSAFKALLRAPSPYGLGLADADVASEEWPKAGVVLFVVKHAKAFFGLNANVLKPDWAKLSGALRFQGMYGWANHKVLKVNCKGKFRYFDPCYNQVYLQPQEMADWTLTDCETELVGKVPCVTRYKGRDRAGRPVVFRAVGSATPDVLKANVRTADNGMPILIGPL